MYNILYTPSREEMEREVNARLKKGWVCLGGLSIHSNGYGVYFYQPMVKFDKEEDK
jgi:hypothetical protein